MKFKEYGSYAPEALENLEEVQPLEIAQKSSLNRLNYLVGFFKEQRPKEYDKYLKNLQKKLSDLVKKDFTKQSKLDLAKSLKELPNLQDKEQLAINSVNYVLQLLEIPDDVDWVNNKIKVPQGNYFRSFLIPRYQNAVVFSETLGREEGIKLYKVYKTEYVNFSIPESKNQYSNLDDKHKDNVKDFESNGNPGWVRIEGSVENGKLVYRRDTCLWAEAMKGYPDDEFKYLATCYEDFQGIKKTWNENFVLTMDHTLAKGDLYCSCVIHDTRIDWDLTHPSEEFWESIWPLQKWQKKNE
ncbi:MAG: hypothetical protein GNW80_11840 [Asgard group archaeon]|nr:hypothetical protein [Asgard group archaeon]